MNLKHLAEFMMISWTVFSFFLDIGVLCPVLFHGMQIPFFSYTHARTHSHAQAQPFSHTKPTHPHLHSFSHIKNSRSHTPSHSLSLSLSLSFSLSRLTRFWPIYLVLVALRKPWGGNRFFMFLFHANVLSVEKWSLKCSFAKDRSASIRHQNENGCWKSEDKGWAGWHEVAFSIQ